MNRLSLSSVCWCGLWCLLAPGAVRAQYTPYGQQPAPYARPPAISPYLDLVRSRNTPAINYFLGTRPQFQLRDNTRDLYQLDRDFAASQRTVAGLEDEEQRVLQPTGHLTQFMNLGAYYPGYGQTGLNQRPLPPRNQQQSRPSTGRPR